MDDGEVARYNRVDYNASLPFEYAEEQYLIPLPCMREEYYPLKDNVVWPLQNGPRIANLQRGRAWLGQTHKGPEPHAPSWGNQLIVLVVCSLALASCVSHAEIVNETATGGTILYSYVEEQDVLTSSGRQDALRLLGEKCPTGYRISREGEVPRVDQAVDRAWMGQLSRDGQVSRERRWAIQFTCK